ncbi:MAG: OadG family protein [Oscillospiraceae bacterium]|nr:OadG family protein [Oscillospiraceae bacterium]
MNNDITVVQTLGVVVLGMGTVFAVLVLLWALIIAESKILEAMENNKKAAKAPTTATPAPSAPVAKPAPTAKGSCGGVMLHDVPDRTAAMIMAIVADELKTPLNELRFISIKEVK